MGEVASGRTGTWKGVGGRSRWNGQLGRRRGGGKERGLPRDRGRRPRTRVCLGAVAAARMPRAGPCRSLGARALRRDSIGEVRTLGISDRASNGRSLGSPGPPRRSSVLPPLRADVHTAALGRAPRDSRRDGELAASRERRWTGSCRERSRCVSHADAAPAVPAPAPGPARRRGQQGRASRARGGPPRRQTETAFPVPRGGLK